MNEKDLNWLATTLSSWPSCDDSDRYMVSHGASGRFSGYEICDYGFTKKQWEERKLLIAAAPELYEALEAAIDLLSSAEIQESVRVRGMTKIIRLGGDALEKARGES